MKKTPASHPEHRSLHSGGRLPELDSEMCVERNVRRDEKNVGIMPDTDESLVFLAREVGES